MSLTKQYFKYVSQNIFGLLGTSCYILADTYFISQAAGTSGVALLNLCLPIYNFIFAIGSMLGLGAATRYAILRAQGDERSERYFSNALLWALVFALPFMLAGIFCPEVLLRFMGGDAEIVALGVGYARIFLLFTPFFMCNYIVSAFVRNDGDPSLAMVATLCGSLFNVVFDYIFMFPMGLGLPGAALATAVSPVLSIAICSRHFFKKSILEYCYDPEAKQFYDYDYVNGRRSDVLSGAVFALLYSGAVPREYAGHIVQALLRLEFPYGIAACEDKPYDYPYQWSYPNTWPPVCFYTVMGLARYGYGEEAERIAVKWMKAVTESFKTTGNLWEKYNVETGTTDVSNEYEMPAMLGWTAGTFICLDDYLAGEMQPDPLPTEYMSY